MSAQPDSLPQEHRVHIDQMPADQVIELLEKTEQSYRALCQAGLSLDLTRGKPSAEQTQLSDALDGILGGDYMASDGTDTRNYGGLDGLLEAKALFGQMLGVPAQEVLVGGNSSLALMYLVVDFAQRSGFGRPWLRSDASAPKILCPSPGYDRHFAICDYLGIEMIPIPMLETGPDMDAAERAIAEHDNVCGIWCVPRFSNPTGCIYSDETLARLAALPKRASSHFLILYDNAYAVHALTSDAPALGNIRDYALAAETEDHLIQFGSTSKITFAGAGIAFLASSSTVLTALKHHLSFQTIGPDKVNQLRHVRMFDSFGTLQDHMQKHASLLQPKFDAVISTLQHSLGGTGMGSWTHPKGGYFISFETLPGLAQRVVALAADAGVKLTPAGATFPYGKDPNDSNIRIAPSFPNINDVQAAVDAFVICVKLATFRNLANQASNRTV